MKKIKAKSSKLESLQFQVDELTNKWKRALADYQNLEKRIAKEKEDFVKFYNATLLIKLLAVSDDLVQAEKHLKDQSLSLIVAKLKNILKEEGLEEIKSDGTEFDAQTMECVELVKGEKNKVIETTIKGYLLNNKVLRPAKVKVGKGKINS